MRIASILFVGLIASYQLLAQTTHKAWLDSIQSQTYIGMEVWLDELEVSEQQHEAEAAAFGFYKNNPLNSTEDILSRLSGISMIRRGNYAWEPTINGLSSGQVNVAIDGMRMFGACTDKMDPVSSYVEPNNLESVAIEKGGAGSAHGSTVGGAVDFRLKRPRFNSKIGGTVNSRYESVSNGFSQSASVNYGGKRLAVRMNASYRNFGDYRTGEGVDVYHSGYKKLNYSLSTSYQTSANNLVEVDFLLDDARDVGYPGLPMDVAFAKAKIGAITYTIFEPLPWINQLAFKAYANKVDHLMDDSKRMDVPVRMDMPGRTNTYGAYIEGNASLSKHALRFKLDGYATNAYAEMTMFVPNETDMFMLTWPDVDRQDVGLFIADQWKPTDRLSTTLTFRAEQAFTKMKSQMGRNQFNVFGYDDSNFEVGHLVVNTGMMANYQWSKSWSTRIGISYGERLPSVSEMFGFYLYNNFDGYDYIGNPEIEKERSIQLTGGVKYQVAQNLEIDLNGFYYWFDDYIIGYIDESLDPMTIGANGVRVYENVSGVTFTGFDARLMYKPSNNLQVLYTSKATYAREQNGDPLPLIPPLKNNLSLVGLLKGYKIQVEGEWAMAQNRVSERAGEMATSDYQLVHLRGSKDWLWGQSTLGLSLGVENLLDENYREHLDWGGVLRPGRNYYISLNIAW